MKFVSIRDLAPARPDPRRGIALMAMGIALFSVLNGAVKDLAETFPINQIVFFRNFFALPPLFLLALSGGGMQLLRIRRPGLQTFLAAVFSASVILTFQAYATMPLADVTAIGFSQPLIVVLIAGLWGREKPRPLEWCTVIVGMFGIGLMVEPSGQGNGLGTTLALGGAASAALGMVLQRQLSLFDSSQSIAFYMLMISSLLIAPTLAVSWVPPSPSQWDWLIGMGIASGCGQFLMVRAFYHASASAVAPITYTKMFWAIIIGFVWFGDVPTWRVMLGTCVVLLTAAIAFKVASDAGRRPAVEPNELNRNLP